MEIDFNKVNREGKKVRGKIVHEGIPDAVDFRNGKVVTVPELLYDMASVKKVFQGFDNQVDQVYRAITGFEIATDDDASAFTETVGVAKRLIKAIDSKRKDLIKDADGFVRSVNSFVRKYRKRLEDVERLGKQKIGQWNYQKEIERREAEKKIQEAAAKKQAEIDAAAKKAGVESVKLPPMALPKKIDAVRSDSASATTRFKKVPKVVDFAKLDDRFKMVDMKALQNAVDAGERPQGVVIEEVPIVSVRSA